MSQSIEDGLVERLRANLAEVGALPISPEWMYEVIRHGVRNMDVEWEDEGNEPENYAGSYIAAIVNDASEAADTITRLKEALEPFAADWDAAQAYKDFLGADRREVYLANCVDLAAFERARTTLSSLGGIRD